MQYLSFHLAVEKKKETITESAGRQQKKKIGKPRKGAQCPRRRGKLRNLWKWSSLPSFQKCLFKMVQELIPGPMTGI